MDVNPAWRGGSEKHGLREQLDPFQLAMWIEAKLNNILTLSHEAAAVKRVLPTANG